MSNRDLILSNEQDAGHTLPYVINLVLCDDVAATIREDGGERPDDVHGASFTHDLEWDPETSGVIYLPHDVDLRTIIHEASHAVIGLYHRYGKPVPTRDSDGGDEELFVETIALLSTHIIEAIHPEVPTCQ